MKLTQSFGELLYHRASTSQFGFSISAQKTSREVLYRGTASLQEAVSTFNSDLLQSRISQRSRLQTKHFSPYQRSSVIVAKRYYNMGRQKRKVRPTIIEEGTMTNVGGDSHAQRLRDSSRNSGNVTQGSNSGSSSNGATGEMPTGPKRRGPTKLDDIWKMPPGQKKKVACNNLGQPIGDEGLKLSEYMTLVVKYNCPLNYESWSKVPPLTKKHLVGIVSEKFDYPAQIDCWFKKTMSKKFRDYKSDLKSTYYDAKESTDFNLRNCPPNVDPLQWAFLVDHWNSEKGKKAEERAKTCRAQQKITHTTGSKSFARFGAEMDIANGAEVGRIEKYEATHTKKDGSYLDPAVKEIVEKAKAKKMETAATPSDNAQLQEIEILTEVLGNQRYGRVSGLGTGPTPTSVFGPFSAFPRSSVSELEMAAMNKKLMEQDIEISTLKRQMAQIMSAVGQSQPNPTTSPGNTLGSSSHSSHHPAGQQNRTI